MQIQTRQDCEHVRLQKRNQELQCCKSYVEAKRDQGCHYAKSAEAAYEHQHKAGKYFPHDMTCRDVREQTN